jgi:hypothetical protein
VAYVTGALGQITIECMDVEVEIVVSEIDQRIALANEAWGREV